MSDIQFKLIAKQMLLLNQYEKQYEPYYEPTCANHTFHICGIQKPKSDKSPSPNYISLDYIDFTQYSHACLHVAL